MSVLDDSMNAIVTTIQGLDLSGIRDDEIVKRWLPWDGDRMYPGITVHPDDESVVPLHPVSRDDIGYGIRVTIVRGISGLRDRITEITDWRQQIRRAFIHQRLAGVSGVYECTIEHRELVIPKKFEDRYHVSSMVIRCWSREART